MEQGLEKIRIRDVLMMPLRFLWRYWLIFAAAAVGAALLGAACLSLWHNRSLLTCGAALIVLSIVAAIIFFITWVTRRYAIRQQLIATYGRECCIPTEGSETWRVPLEPEDHSAKSSGKPADNPSKL